MDRFDSSIHVWIFRMTFAVAAGAVAAHAPRAEGASFMDWLRGDRSEWEAFQRGKPASPPTADKAAAARADAGFAYVYQGRTVNLVPSPRLAALAAPTERHAALARGLREAGLERDPLSDRLTHPPLLLLRQVAVSPDARAPAATAYDALRAFLAGPGRAASEEGAAAQPVFEFGEALGIPTSQIIVGFEADVPAARVREALGGAAREAGVRNVTPHRPRTYLVETGDASNGRAFDAARQLAAAPGVAFAEPNLRLLFLFDRETAHAVAPADPAPGARPASGRAEAEERILPVDLATPQGAWTTIFQCDAESTGFPPAGWECGPINGPDVAWGRTSSRRHGGSWSLYCAGAGGAGVRPPGPVPLKSHCTLRSPALDLSGYADVFIKAWYLARNELDANGTLRDGAYMGLSDGSKAAWTCLATGANEDTSTDPNGERGWRHVLYRVPASMLKRGCHVFWEYVADDRNAREGCYIDDLRIVGLRAFPAVAEGNDPYLPRAYALRNTGQIAGYGAGLQGMRVPDAWRSVALDTNLIVAVVDTGVDLQHPDLNLVQGVNNDGSPGGGPAGTSGADAHGTAVAGCAGAKLNNGLGAAGTAPGVRILPVCFGGANGQSSLAECTRAIDLAVARGARIINCSWGSVGSYSRDVENAVRAAVGANRVVVFAAGNGPCAAPWSYDVGFPGSLTRTCDIVCVGGSGPGDDYAGVSGTIGLGSSGASYAGDGPDVCAPFAWVFATDVRGAAGWNDGTNLGDADYAAELSGTSFSAPLVSGVVALMLSANPALTPGEVKRILRETADDIDAPGLDDRTGAGRVNALRAVQAAQRLTIVE